MKRISTGILAALAALSLASAGCSKDKKDETKGNAAKVKDGDKAGDKGGDKGGDKAGDKGGDKPSAGSATGYAVFPADAELVLSFSLEGLRTSPMWAQIAPLVAAKLDAEMKDLKEACGLDPIAKLQSVHVGGKPSDDKSMVIVVKGFNKGELKTCGEAMAKKEGKAFTMVEEDGLTKMTNEGKDVYMAWLDDTTALISPNPDKAWIKDRAAGKNGLEGNAAFMDLLKNVDTAATVWVAALPAPGSDMDMSKNLPGAKGGFGSLKVVDGLAIDAGIRFDTADNAKSAHAMATAGLAQAKGMMPPPVQSIIDKAKISANGSDVVVQLSLSNADLESLASALGPMMGGMMGGM